MEHYMPTFTDGIAQEKDEIIAIATNPENISEAARQRYSLLVDRYLR